METTVNYYIQKIFKETEDNIIHKVGCLVMPTIQREYLGNFMHVNHAIKNAKKQGYGATQACCLCNPTITLI